jgi:hypothetical protein
MKNIIYKKKILLRSGGEKIIGKVIKFWKNEKESLFEDWNMSVVMIGNNVMFVMCVK